jgi:hypothetical protein
VPVSWVCDRTRKRSLDRLPGIRRGKYWRFRQGDVIAWVRHTRGTLLHEYGTPLKVAQAQLSRLRMATTLEEYTHASTTAQR